jgi:hypothetical protein
MITETATRKGFRGKGWRFVRETSVGAEPWLDGVALDPGAGGYECSGTGLPVAE